MQKAVIVRDKDNGTDYLNELLGQNWRVVSTCPMTSSTAKSGYTFHPTCLVILSNDHST